MGLNAHVTTTEDADGNTLTETHNTIEVTADSARQCSTCVLSAACPSFNPGSSCAYNIPVVIQTKDQREALFRALVEIQGQRIMFGAFSEQALGTHDIQVGKEIDRLFNMVKAWKEIEERRTGIHVSIDAQGEAGQAAGMGMISRLFGEQAGINARALDRPMIVDEVIEEVEMVPTGGVTVSNTYGGSITGGSGGTERMIKAHRLYTPPAGQRYQGRAPGHHAPQHPGPPCGRSRGRRYTWMTLDTGRMEHQMLSQPVKPGLT